PALRDGCQAREGSRSSKTRRETSSPETTHSDFATSSPSARADSGTVASLVTSPDPRSSARKARRRASLSAARGGSMRGGGYIRSRVIPRSSGRQEDGCTRMDVTTRAVASFQSERGRVVPEAGTDLDELRAEARRRLDRANRAESARVFGAY